MELLNDAINETEKYVRFIDFLCYLAYKLDENIEKVVIFLLYNGFDESSWEYYINRHYRIYEFDEVDCAFKTSVLLEQITKDGFFNYLMFCHDFFDDYQGIATDLDYYEPIRIDFYYSLAILENMPFLKKLNLDLKDAGKLDYTVYSDDSVKAEQPIDERLFRLIDLKNNHTIEYLRPNIKEYGYHSQVGIVSKTVTPISDNINKIPVPTVTQTEPPSSEQLVKELKAAKAKIANLESQLAQAQSANTPADGDMLQTIFDDSHEHHAPDLKHAINLWADLYIKGDIKDDSHSNRAAYWISKNTKYSENAKTSTDRIKEISSPSRYWSPHRKKENLE